MAEMLSVGIQPQSQRQGGRSSKGEGAGVRNFQLVSFQRGAEPRKTPRGASFRGCWTPSISRRAVLFSGFRKGPDFGADEYSGCDIKSLRGSSSRTNWSKVAMTIFAMLKQGKKILGDARDRMPRDYLRTSHH